MDTTLVGTIILGSLSSAMLVVWRKRAGKPVSAAEAVCSFLVSGGIAVGVAVCRLSLNDAANLRGLDGQRIYVLLAGLCTIWISAMAIQSLFRPPGDDSKGQISES